MRKIALLIIWVSLAFAAISCGSDVYYEKIHSINRECWNKQDSVVCEFDIEDSLQFFTIYMNIRNSVSYRYQNLYLFMDTQNPMGECSRDTLEFVLADAYGNWKGKGDRLKDYQYFFYPKVRFPYKGHYRFTFYQAMREEDLKGIANFGMTVKTFDERKFQKEIAKRRKDAAQRDE